MLPSHPIKVRTPLRLAAEARRNGWAPTAGSAIRGRGLDVDIGPCSRVSPHSGESTLHVSQQADLRPGEVVSPLYDGNERDVLR